MTLRVLSCSRQAHEGLGVLIFEGGIPETFASDLEAAVVGRVYQSAHGGKETRVV